MINFLNPEYLARGNSRQKKIFRIISGLNIFSILKEYSPVVTGTIPIDIDIESSDIDILCHYKEQGDFEHTINENYASFSDFQISKIDKHGISSVVAAFNYRGDSFEIFGQSVPVEHQNGYIHMLVEYRILQLMGQNFKNEIRNLKRNGFKTEPAFGKMLKIDSDPYRALLDCANLNDSELKKLLNGIEYS